MTRPMPAVRLRRLMAAPDVPEPTPWGPNTPEVQRILVRHREAVAQATEQASRELRRLGFEAVSRRRLLVGAE